MNDRKQLIIFTDGGSRGNPGPAALGVHIEDSDEEMLFSVGEPIGITTNNVAEYKAVVKALAWAVAQKDLESKFSSISFFLDSELVCRQINGIYKVKNETLRSIVITIWELRKQLPLPSIFTHIRREKNKKADRLVNMALDRNAAVTYNKV